MKRMLRMGAVWLVLLVLVLGVPNKLFAQEKDSIWIHILSADEGKDEEKKLQISLQWEVYIRKFDSKRKKFGDWEKVADPSEYQMTFRPKVSYDSIFTNVIAQAEVKDVAYTFKGLEFDRHLWITVDLVTPDLPFKCFFAEGIIYKHSAQLQEKKGGIIGLIVGYWRFLKTGGLYVTGPQHILLLFALVALFMLWRRNLFANIFPPNKPSLLYRILPIDKTGKTELYSEKGNIFLREVAKYWSKAMESMALGPEHFSSTDEYVKTGRQEQEEMEKKMWLEVGLPNVEKAIEICKNGVPGIKLPKKPIEYPTVRVLLAALENHRSNKNQWWASQEMDRAAENTVLKEIDELKGFEITLLWAIAVLEPMLGLFGTVIGIRMSFMQIEETIKLNPNAQLTQIVPKLAGGIQVALITTIVGLYLGMPISAIYYYYQGKIGWVFGKWEEIITGILNQA